MQYEILLVDDEHVILDTIGPALEEKGYKVTSVDNGKAAIELIAKRNFDLVITDLVMDEPDGIQVLKNTKELNPETMVIILTGYGDMESAVNALRLGTDDYLAKPCDIQEIYFRVSKCLEKQGLNREIDRQREALRENEERYRSIIEGSHDMIQSVRLDGSFDFVNRAWLDRLGYSEAELPSLKLFDIIHPDSSLHCQEVFLKVMAGQRINDIQATFVTKDGAPVLVEGNASPRTLKGKIIATHSLFRDITERKQAQERLERNKKEWEATFDAISDWVCLIDLEHRILRSNRAVEGFSEMPSAKVLGLKCCQVAHGSETPISGCPFHKMLQTHSHETGEIHLPEPDRWLMVAVDPVRDGDGNIVGAVHIVRDITEIKKMEAERIKIEKFKSLEILAGGIAHQFNNALTPIIGNADLLKLKHREDQDTMECLKDMKNSGLRMADLTSQMLAYAEGGKYNPQIQSLSDFVDATLPLIQHTLDPTVRVETDLPLEVKDVEADGTQMQMVLSAIMANSNEAIEGPGRIRISTRNMDLDQELIKDYPGLKPGPHVCLSIEDDGKGMDEETRERIFDPFFTTHFMGRGLAMAAVYGIIKNHDGAITVDSELGKGTMVRIYLPAIEPEKEVKKKTVSRLDLQLPKGDAAILVIEDEEDVMMLIRRVLERLGYRVLQAETGKKAVKLAKTFDGQIDLAILDIKLPDMTGDKVYPLIMEARPDLKVVVCSGYAIDGPPQDILDAGAEGFIQKPFSTAAFADKLKEVLEGK